MGLDTIHDAFHGAYSSFMRFRRGLVEHSLNLDIRDFEGYDGNIPYTQIQDAGLRRLVNQSDCDGEISPEDCKLIADYLTSVIPDLPVGDLLQRAEQFREGCLLAYSKNEFIIFH